MVFVEQRADAVAAIGSDGAAFALLVTAEPIRRAERGLAAGRDAGRDGGGEPVHATATEFPAVVAKAHDEEMDAATKHRVRAERFYEMSILDPLTGLYNRRFGETRLREEMALAEKSGDPLLVLALDLDYFKEINDKYGHAAWRSGVERFFAEIAKSYSRVRRARPDRRRRVPGDSAGMPARQGADDFVAPGRAGIELGWAKGSGGVFSRRIAIPAQ